jgi:hypothetical protein
MNITGMFCSNINIVVINTLLCFDSRNPSKHTTAAVTYKVKVPCNRPEGPEGGTGIALLFLDLGARRGWVVSTTPFYNSIEKIEISRFIHKM